jgi:hypothetical protein
VPAGLELLSGLLWNRARPPGPATPIILHASGVPAAVIAEFQMIRFRSTENARRYALGLALAGTLVSLAILQYRSNRQLRDVLQTQMRFNVQGSLMNVRFGLEQEFSPICNAIQSWRTNPGQSNLEFLAKQVDAWRGSAVHPALIKAVFFYDLPQELYFHVLFNWSRGTTCPPQLNGQRTCCHCKGSSMMRQIKFGTAGKTFRPLLG